MKTSVFAVPCLLVLALLGLTAVSPAVSDSKLERGRYLVEQVALCGDCHTPHNEKGEPIREKLLQGAPPGRPPMPQYRFSEEDATAVVAYLRSLAPAGRARK